MAKTKPVYKPYNLETYPSDGKYGSRQIILTGDRILFNAKSDSAFITAQEAISLSTNGNIHLDTLYERNKKIVLSSPNIILGLDSNFKEPVDYAVRGRVLMSTLVNLIEAIQNIVISVSELDYEAGTGDPVDANDLDDLLDNNDTLDKIKEYIENGEFLSPRVKIS